ncbi:MAG: ImmA/IrrE family metallo-endopeptidase [Paludibacteraceae bacterium]
MSDNISNNIQIIWEIFRVSTVEGLVSSYSKEPEIALFKNSEKLQTSPVNLFGWKNLTIWKADKINLSTRFDSANEQEIITELNTIFYENTDTLNRIKTTLNKFGIKFLIVEKFDQTPIDGLSFWRGENPTIVLTLRMKNIDNLAFSTLHELAHIIQHLCKNSEKELINIDGYHTDIEDEANVYAQNALIPSAIWKAFMKSTSAISPHAIQHRIKTLSNDNKINEAIALGLYKHEMNFYSIKTDIVRSIG